MIKRILVLVLLLPVFGCGYHVVKTPKVAVFVAPVDNRSNHSRMGILVERAVENQLLQHGMVLADDGNSADIRISLQLNAGGKRTVQSGADNRMTTSRETVGLKAEFLEKSGKRTMNREFLLLSRFPTESRYYYNDSGREEKELAGQMAQQVVAWLTNP
ncbi:MAG: hypothetical protein CO090_10220 [Acidobacteria bacterium CG_4_9_14_3_um_filter_49_7]|nr:MAG: hypothetical protein CO090_10220 [Acidobacteria bacterium CG_4_9_14_3_um_filter_49_7]